MEMDFETIHGALCFDSTLPPGKEIITQDLTLESNGKYINAVGDVYERAIDRQDGGPERYVLVKKKELPAGNEVRRKSVTPKTKFLDQMLR